MAVTQYIGARYVPIFADPAEWTSTKHYEPLTIVLHEGNSYTSKQFVPVGVDINNTNYWAETGNYNSQVEAYREEVQQSIADINESFADFETDVNNKISTIREEVESFPFVDGLFCVSTDRANTERPAYSMLYQNGKLKYINLFCDEFFGVSKRTPVDSSCLFKIGDYYYYAPNNSYAYSKDFENWQYGTIAGLNANPILEQGLVWGPNCVMQTEDNRILWFGSIQYKTGTMGTYGIVDALGTTTSYLMRAAYIELVQDEFGVLSLAPNSQWTPIPALSGGDNTSYIDPAFMYSKKMGKYVLAVKNEITKKIEMYSGSSVNNLTEIVHTDSMFGVEAPKLFEDEQGVGLFVTGYATMGYGYPNAGCSGTLVLNCILMTRITDKVLPVFLDLYRWDVIPQPINSRHLGIINIDNTISKYIQNKGVSNLPSYLYNGLYDSCIIQFNSNDAVTDVTKPYNNSYVCVSDLPNILYSFTGTGGYREASGGEVKPVSINAYVCTFGNMIIPLFSRTDIQTRYTPNVGFLGAARTVLPHTKSGHLYGYLARYNNSQYGISW